MKMIKLKRLVQNNRVLYLLLFPAIFSRRLLLKKEDARFFKSYRSMMESVEGGSLIIRVPDFAGSFEIDIRSHILRRLLRKKSYEPNLVSLINIYIDRQKEVIDVGANIGLFTVLFSKTISKGNKVLAVEPTPLAQEYLKKNLDRNECSDSVMIYEGISTDKQGNYKMNVISGMEEYSSLGNISHPAVVGKASCEIDIKGDTIDNMVERFGLTPGFLKIDTEGAEYLVLKGALHTIKKEAPIILSELDDDMLANCGANSKMVIDLLQGNGYEVRDANNMNAPIEAPFRGEIIAFPRSSNSFLKE